MVKIGMADIYGDCLADRFRAYLAPNPDIPNTTVADLSSHRSPFNRLSELGLLKPVSGIFSRSS
jgi:hypothetical protein